ncbi:hypothetical protein PoB_007498700 [Plakobranchus ocellatus]|uniref:Uncharacterized protein n=1 Tax=Plakobranchus ocellatus TaxID=259542 RepID=A0AAV4DW07_9GAST|nr:hypothetical protein PoB_007498700 [Plakobranchus ocellatus]
MRNNEEEEEEKVAVVMIIILMVEVAVVAIEYFSTNVFVSRRILIFDVFCGMEFKTSNQTNVAVPTQRGQTSRGRRVYQPVFQEKIQGKLIIKIVRLRQTGGCLALISGDIASSRQFYGHLPIEHFHLALWRQKLETRHT